VAGNISVGSLSAPGIIVNTFQPHETPYDLYFTIAGIPVRVHPFFWVVAAFLGISAGDLFTLVGWVLAVFIAVLVHELGHALTMRAFGYYPRITLYGLGGYTEYGMRDAFVRPPRALGRIVILAAGPGTGFLLAAVLAGMLLALGQPVAAVVGWPIGIYVVTQLGHPWMTEFVNSLFFVTVGWGILNLLPVLPLDGGQILREILGLRDPSWGTFRAAQISFLVGAGVAFWAALSSNFFLAILFGYLAYTNYQLLRGPQLW
jgi:membrane-associated protease RseP (regulator of RpoE activity)